MVVGSRPVHLLTCDPPDHPSSRQLFLAVVSHSTFIQSDGLDCMIPAYLVNGILVSYLLSSSLCVRKRNLISSYIISFIHIMFFLAHLGKKAVLLPILILLLYHKVWLNTSFLDVMSTV